MRLAVVDWQKTFDSIKSFLTDDFQSILPLGLKYKWMSFFVKTIFCRNLNYLLKYEQIWIKQDVCTNLRLNTVVYPNRPQKHISQNDKKQPDDCHRINKSYLVFLKFPNPIFSNFITLLKKSKKETWKYAEQNMQ